MNITAPYIKKLINGSYDAFTWLYHLYAPQLYTYVFSLTKSESLTRDIVQEIFIKVWVKRTEIREDLSFKSFLFTIAKNMLLNEFRRQLKNPVFSDYMLLKITEETAEDDQIKQHIDFDEFNRQLQLAKKKISPRQAQIFELNKEQGLSIEEIAEKLGIKKQVVRNQLSLALHALRNEMGRFIILFTIFFM